MKIKILQLNIRFGLHLDRIIRYIKENDFDIVNLQEVAGGYFSSDKGNNYEKLIEHTGMEGELAIYVHRTGTVTSFRGNATLYKRNWIMLSNHTIWMKRYKEVDTMKTLDPRKSPRCALCTLLEKDGKQLLVINTHLAWGPTAMDALYKKNQADRLYRWIKNHDTKPFVLTGDFNLNPQTVIVRELSSLGVNLIKRNHVTNTLNPRVHYAKNLFPSGLPVDYIIADKRIKVEKFFVEQKDLSDHLGLVMACDI
jgi:endonuclease/exonuclease/phosphatase family metal-dependent hydrolase